jgi:hypothetical protein
MTSTGHRFDRLGHQAGDEIDALHANAVGSFSVEGEEEFADEWIEHNRDFTVSAPPFGWEFAAGKALF